MKEAAAEREADSGNVGFFFSVIMLWLFSPSGEGQSSVSGSSTVTCVQFEASRNILECQQFSLFHHVVLFDVKRMYILMKDETVTFVSLKMLYLSRKDK